MEAATACQVPWRQLQPVQYHGGSYSLPSTMEAATEHFSNQAGLPCQPYNSPPPSTPPTWRASACCMKGSSPGL